MNITHITYTAADEIDRRAYNKANPQEKTVFPKDGIVLVDGEPTDVYLHVDPSLLNKSGAELRAVTTAKPQVETAQVQPEPKKDRRVIEMSDELRALRQELYAKHGGGQAYHDACKKAGIPTKKNGLLNA